MFQYIIEKTGFRKSPVLGRYNMTCSDVMKISSYLSASSLANTASLGNTARLLDVFNSGYWSDSFFVNRFIYIGAMTISVSGESSVKIGDKGTSEPVDFFVMC